MPTDKKSELKPPPEPTAYEVGYGKPPKASRFAPGQSGNKKGRPKGAHNKSPGPNENRLSEILLAEAYRPIKVNEGKKRVTMPMIEAVVRSLSINAARGHLRSQQTFTKMLAETERTLALQKKQLLETTLSYKLMAEDELERRSQLGISGPAIIPHPDDIDIDMRTGDIKFTGPMSRKDKAEWDYFDKRVEEIDRDLERFNDQLKKIRSKKLRASIEGQIADERANREMIVDRLGEPSKRRKG